MYTTSESRPLVEITLDEWRSADSSSRERLAVAVDGSARDPGAFLLRPTAAMKATVADAVAATRAFFALPLTTKRECEDPFDQFVGYRGLGANRNTYGATDLKEMFHIGPGFAPSLASAGAVDVSAAMQSSSLWPDLPSFVESWHRYYALMQEISHDLRAIFELALGGGDDVLSDLWSENSADLAANSYPVVDPVHRGQTRNAAHTDQTLFTILHQDGRAAGLSIEWKSGTWEPVELDGSAFLVNIGQLFELLTAGTWRAVPHRVEPAQPVAHDRKPRLTIPFFFRPRATALLRPLPRFAETDESPPTMAEWLAARRAPVPVSPNPS